MIWTSVALAGFAGNEGELILISTEVVADVRSDLAVVDVNQTFENPFQVAMDATYVFPLPVGAAVRDLVITCGDRVIRGEIQSKAEARKTYDEALQNGRRAALLEQQRDNLFTQRVGGLCPGETVGVKLQYVEDLAVGDDIHTFTFPTTTGHRYDPKGLREAPLIPSSTPGRALTVDLQVHTGTPIASIWSDDYAIDVIEESTQGARIGLSQPALPNGDVQIRWKLATDEPEVTALTAKDRHGMPYVGLTVQPPTPEMAPDSRKRELIFVLDSSCSMSGEPWADASEMVTLAMSAMRPGETFNLVRFADESTAAFPEPMAVGPDSLQRAQYWLDHQGSGGGTDMVEGVLAALDMPGDPEALRMVVLLTDGYIGTEHRFFQAVSEHLTANDRIFGLGIGSSVNRLLIEGLAHHGGGTSLVQLPGTPMEETIRTLYKRIDRPVLTDISVDWGDLQVEMASSPRDLFVGQPLHLVGRVFGGQSGTVRVTGQLAGKPWSTDVEVDLDEAEIHEALPSLWARKRIAGWTYDLEANAAQQEERISALAVEHHLVSAYTSLVAVDSQPAGCGEAAPAQVPALAPAGTSYASGGFGSRGLGTGGGGIGRLIGAGGMGSAGAGYGSGGGSFGSKTAGSAQVAGSPVIMGSLDKSLIERVIKRHLNAIRYCYQRELSKQATLGGTLAIKFTIGADGSVAEARVRTSTLNNSRVESCVIGRFLRMQFPAPSGGGVIRVTYPFVFNPQ